MPLSSVKRAAEVLVDRVDDAELAGQPLGAEPVGDGQPRRVVGEHEVLVAELDRGERHLLDRRAAVGPVGVRVQVAAQRGPQLRAAGRERAGVLASSSASRSGSSPAHGVRDHRRRCSRRCPGRLGERAGLGRGRATSSAGSGRIVAAALRNALTL